MPTPFCAVTFLRAESSRFPVAPSGDIMRRTTSLTLAAAVLLLPGFPSALRAGLIQTFADATIDGTQVRDTHGGVGVGLARAGATTTANGNADGSAEAEAGFKHVGIGLHTSAEGPGHAGATVDAFADARDSFFVVPTNGLGNPLGGPLF